MSMQDSMLKTPVDEGKINSHYQKLLSQHKQDDGHPNVLKDRPHEAPPNSGRTPDGPFGTPIMKTSDLMKFLEAVEEGMAQLAAEEEIDPTKEKLEGMPTDPEEHGDLVGDMDKLCTPMLIMQGFENDIADKATENFGEAHVMTEQNIFKFDDSTRMAQLISIAARVIARKKQTEKWKLWEKASMIARQANLDIQKEEYDAAKALVQQYLVKVSTTNNSSVARKAATDLLPATQH